jgi:hypothetical protein
MKYFSVIIWVQWEISQMIIWVTVQHNDNYKDYISNSSYEQTFIFHCYTVCRHFHQSITSQTIATSRKKMLIYETIQMPSYSWAISFEWQTKQTEDLMYCLGDCILDSCMHGIDLNSINSYHCLIFIGRIDVLFDKIKRTSWLIFFDKERSRKKRSGGVRLVRYERTAMCKRKKNEINQPFLLQKYDEVYRR